MGRGMIPLGTRLVLMVRPALSVVVVGYFKNEVAG